MVSSSARARLPDRQHWCPISPSDATTRQKILSTKLTYKLLLCMSVPMVRVYHSNPPMPALSVSPHICDTSKSDACWRQ